MAEANGPANFTVGSNVAQLPQTSSAVVNFFLVVEFLLALHVTVALIYEGRMMETATRDRGRLRRKSTPKQALHILCIIAASITVASILKSLYFSNAKIQSTDACNVTETFAISVFVIHDMVIHMFMWIRQYVICRAVTEKNGCMRMSMMCMNYGVLIMCVSLSVAVISLTATQRPFSYDEVSGNCLNSATFTVEVATIWGPGSFSIHIILFSLFIIPLLKQFIESKSRDQGSSAGFSNTRTRLVSLMRRCLLITGVCVATDFIAINVRSYAFSEDHIYPRGALLFNANLIVNVVLIIFSFNEWRLMLFPWIRPESESSTLGLSTTVGM